MVTDSLQRGIEHAQATEITPGRYAFKFGISVSGEPLYAIVDEDGLRHLAAVLDESVPEAERVRNEGASDFDGWYEADDRIIEMPSWWSPNQRFAWRWTSYYVPGSAKSNHFASRDEAFAWARENAPHLLHRDSTASPERVTVDCETGDEIVASK